MTNKKILYSSQNYVVKIISIISNITNSVPLRFDRVRIRFWDLFQGVSLKNDFEDGGCLS